MASTIDLSGLEHYMKVVEEYGILLKDFRMAMIELCEKASEFARKKYSEHGHNPPSITVGFEPHGTRATIYAKGDAVAFFEFGTGEYAKGTYQGNLPQSGVPETEEWVYYYDSPHKTERNGEKGWKWGHAFVKGNPAEAEMWETSQYIRQQAHIIIQKYFQNESGGK